MKTNTEGAFHAQSVPNPPFLDSRIGVGRPSPITVGGRFIARRYHVAPGLADTIAALAGFEQEAH
ncbi:hypothetical protein AYJ54_36315 [Bradyrhizobium centrolobii]|uniref:Uncharacterized protein n=1 Tax=Bradyrhizobium centrolobii TaxID=1505087 RepID=A0A176Y8Q6_9BRAD|nr:hypothetical protein [Bradyrhizobium centrolobii]OAE96747.1 hypothetical protein AYJ54_36315 [Bradyrhizobium centrolobii]